MGFVRRLVPGCPVAQDAGRGLPSGTCRTEGEPDAGDGAAHFPVRQSVARQPVRERLPHARPDDLLWVGQPEGDVLHRRGRTTRLPGVDDRRVRGNWRLPGRAALEIAVAAWRSRPARRVPDLRDAGLDRVWREPRRGTRGVRWRVNY